MARPIFALTSLSLAALLSMSPSSPPGSDPLKDGTGMYRFSRTVWGLTPRSDPDTFTSNEARHNRHGR